MPGLNACFFPHLHVRTYITSVRSNAYGDCLVLWVISAFFPYCCQNVQEDLQMLVRSSPQSFSRFLTPFPETIQGQVRVKGKAKSFYCKVTVRSEERSAGMLVRMSTHKGVWVSNFVAVSLIRGGIIFTYSGRGGILGHPPTSHPQVPPSFSVIWVCP